MIVSLRQPDYAPPDFDAESIKGLGTRRIFAPVGDWRPQVHGTPFDTHQDWALGCLLRHDRFLYFADTGLGKTKTGLDAIDYHFTMRGAKHALVVTGSATATFEWAEAAEQWVGIPVTDVQGSVAQRRRLLAEFPKTPIIATDYATLQTAFTKKVPKIGKKKAHFAPDLEALFHFGRMFDIVLLDEVHRLKNEASLRHQMALALVDQIPVRYGLTGTPFDRHPEDAWGQYQIIDGGETFGSRQQFLAHFFDMKKSHWSIYTMEPKFRRPMAPEFALRVRNRGIRVTRKECKHIPDVQRIIKQLPFPPGSIEHFKASHKRIQDARAENEQANEFAFLRQLCSGLLRVRTPELDTTMRLAGSPKLDWLRAFLDELPREEQVVVFYEFRASGEWIDEAVRSDRQTVSWLHGGMPTGKDREVLELWRKKKTRVLVAQTEKASESLNLQQAAYLVQYESPLTYRQEKQSLARVASRIGGREATIYTLMIRGSKEQRILELIREGRALSAELLEKNDEPSGLFR